jgi:uroporphyrinogen decarboxylase
MNTSFQNALKEVPQNVPPVWLMRQAGRYQKTYRALREKHSFIDLCKVPELSAKVGFNAVNEFDFDLCILFSDLLFPLEAFGMGLKYEPGPILGWNLRDKSDFKKFKSTEEAFELIKFQGDCLRATREELPEDKSLIGFVGGFWTLFGYAVDGSHKGNMLETKKSIHLFDEFVENHMRPFLEMNIQLQLDNHAEVVMLFDTAVGEVSSHFFKEKVEPHLIHLAGKFPGKLGYYSKGGNLDYYSSAFLDQPWAGIGWDHRWDLPKVLKNRKHKGFVQGNFDQALLHQDSDSFKKTLDHYLNQFKDLSVEDRRGWVAGLGHGVLPKTPEDNVKHYVNRVREFFS